VATYISSSLQQQQQQQQQTQKTKEKNRNKKTNFIFIFRNIFACSHLFSFAFLGNLRSVRDFAADSPTPCAASSGAPLSAVSAESYATEVGTEVLAQVGGTGAGEVPSPDHRGERGRGGAELQMLMHAELRGRFEELQLQVAAAESLRTAALAEVAAAHALEINQTKVGDISSLLGAPLPPRRS
jgi:hypothetical protein